MALVAYDYDSGSENEDEGSDSAVIVLNNKPTGSVNTQNGNLNNKNITQNVGENFSDKSGINEDVTTEKLPEILSHLPETTKEKTVNVTEDKLEDFIPKYQPPSSTKEKKPQKVKITIPALSEFDDEDDDEPEQKRRKVSAKGSSLLSVLPPVRGSPLSTKSFIPNVLKNKPPVSDKKTNSLIPHAVRKKAEETKKATIKKIASVTAQGSDAESDDDIEVPETFDDEVWQKVCGPKSKIKPQVIERVEPTVNIEAINIAPEPVKPYDGLDNAAFKELVGKAKRPVNIKLIDINEEEIVADNNFWMTKSLTDPDQAPKNAVEDPVDPTRKKKHHITYLAEQAKANEQELQTQWSANKFARNQTRAKYGF
ncbi:hypothetical protein Zmor_005668 [Zophobas morio]|uniref:Proline-rich protein PRCC n=1 Tax=Zophobas morio TaxID=2755281 RepID=A0AA38IUU5_9CUCU|nr:hypothetical protein Zmor_005668 [Zophobas morio]